MTQPASLFPPATAHKSDPLYPISERAADWWFGPDGASIHAIQIYGEASRGCSHAFAFITAWTSFMRQPTQTHLEDAKAAYAAWKQRAMS